MMFHSVLMCSIDRQHDASAFARNTKKKPIKQIVMRRRTTRECKKENRDFQALDIWTRLKDLNSNSWKKPRQFGAFCLMDDLRWLKRWQTMSDTFHEYDELILASVAENTSWLISKESLVEKVLTRNWHFPCEKSHFSSNGISMPQFSAGVSEQFHGLFSLEGKLSYVLKCFERTLGKFPRLVQLRAERFRRDKV